MRYEGATPRAQRRIISGFIDPSSAVGRHRTTVNATRDVGFPAAAPPRFILTAMTSHADAPKPDAPKDVRRGPEPPDLSEKGGVRNGQPQRSDRRLFMQFLAFSGCTDSGSLVRALDGSSLTTVLYEDVNDPRGIGLLTLAEDPSVFVGPLRALLNADPFRGLTLRPEFTMLGRTYALGYEPDLLDTLIARPTRTVLNPAWNWAVWYPLRRNGKFAQLPPDEQRVILAEHGAIGMSFGAGDYAHDIRLACHGLDTSDSDFVVGLIGKDLFPLSAVVQTMRKTQQTSLYLDRLGPFFVGRVVRQSPDRGAV
jgi:hypothetical protein